MWKGFTPESIQGLPAGFVRGCEILERHDKNGADFSVTELLNPPLLSILRRRHDIVTPLDDLMWALFGKAVHVIVEAGASEHQAAEKLICLKVGNVEVAGTPDLYDPDTKTVWDIKTTSVWAAKDGGALKPEWAPQVNLYAHLLREVKGVQVEALKILAIFRDWRPGELKKYAWYPKLRYAVLPVPLWPTDNARNLLAERIELYIEALELSDEELAAKYPCTPEETWHGKRCESYCDVANICKNLQNPNPLPAPTHTQALHDITGLGKTIKGELYKPDAKKSDEPCARCGRRPAAWICGAGETLCVRHQDDY